VKNHSTDVIKNSATLTSHGHQKGRRVILDILEAGLAAPDPYENVQKMVRVEDGKLIIGHPDFSNNPDQQPLVFDLDKVGNIYVVGGGKAVQREAEALEHVLGDLITDGQVNAKKGDTVRLKKIKVTLAGHPIPDEDSVKGASRILEIEQSARKGDIVFWCNSGGGTALQALPVPGITLADLQEVYRVLYRRKRSEEPPGAVEDETPPVRRRRHSHTHHDRGESPGPQNSPFHRR
jgi:glycerate-2-kinase